MDHAEGESHAEGSGVSAKAVGGAVVIGGVVIGGLLGVILWDVVAAIRLSRGLTQVHLVFP